MSPSELFRVLDIQWEPFLWGCLWATIIIIVINATVIIITWDLARKDFVKNSLPQLHKNKVGELLKEIDGLKQELKWEKKWEPMNWDDAHKQRNRVNSLYGQIRRRKDIYYAKMYEQRFGKQR